MKSEMRNTRCDIRNKDISIFLIWIILFSFIAVAIFFKCKYGYTYLDEGFYPTIAYRFIQGDQILVDEWNNTQLSNFILIPLMKFFLRLKGDFTGVYLFIRYIYTICKIIISILIYIVMNKYNKLSAMVASLFFLTYASYGMMVLSYNSIAFGGLLVCLLLLFSERNKWYTARSILAGVFLAVAVLANPYFSALYITYAMVVLILHLYSKKMKKMAIMPYDMNSFVGASVGVASVVIIFCFYVFSHSSLEQISQTLPKIILGDPAHPIKSFYYLTGGYIARIVVGNSKNYFIFIVDILIIVVAVGYFFCSKKEKYRVVYMETQTLLCTILIIVYLVTDNYINHIMFVPNILALALIFATDSELVGRVFVCIWIPGMLCTYFQYLSSNTGFYGISAASSVATIGSIFIIVVTFQEAGLGNIIKTVLFSFLLTAFVSILVLRLSYVFWEDGGITSLTKTIEHGPCKGLVVNENTYNYYNNIYEDTKEIRNMSVDTKVLYISDKSLWLSGVQRCASYSPLCYSISSSNLLFDYYDVHPDKIAEVVYIDKMYKLEFVEQIAARLDMDINERNNGWILLRNQ